jgi:LPXTG-motif cell wall-anchored protein
MTRSRLTALGLLTSIALVAGGTTSAGADEVDDLYAGANAVTASLSVLGTSVGSFAGTSAVAEDSPLVDVASFGFQGPDGTPGIAATRAVVDALQGDVRDPSSAEMLCGIPELDALPVAAVLSIVDVCSASAAALPSLTAPRARGAADGGVVAVNGQALADVVFDLLLEPITAQLQDVVVTAQSALAPVEDALSAICDELPAELSPTGLAETADSAGIPVTDVIKALPDGEEIVASLESDCLLSLDTLVELVTAVPAIAEDIVRQTLLAALDRDLLSVTLGSSTSAIGTDAGLLSSRSQLRALDVSTLSLQFLLDAVEELVAQHVQGVLDAVLAALPAELAAVTSQLPELGDVLRPILDQLEQSGLVDDAPLLQVTLADSVAEARSLPGSSDVDISRSVGGGIVVKISPAIASLLGVPDRVAVAPGEIATIAEGTPLESRISVGAVGPISEVLGTSKIQTAGARVTSTEVALLTGIQGGVVLSTGVTEARVGGTIATAVPAAPPVTRLPTTGSSDEVALIVGMLTLALLGASLTLRRRLA